MARQIQAGKIRDRAKIQQPSGARDSFGDEVLTYTTLATRWCDVEPMLGAEGVVATQVQGEIPLKVTLRYDSTVTGIIAPKWRLVFGTRTLEVTSIINSGERNAKVELACKEQQ